MVYVLRKTSFHKLVHISLHCYLFIITQLPERVKICKGKSEKEVLKLRIGCAHVCSIGNILWMAEDVCMGEQLYTKSGFALGTVNRPSMTCVGMAVCSQGGLGRCGNSLVNVWELIRLGMAVCSQGGLRMHGNVPPSWCKPSWEWLFEAKEIEAGMGMTPQVVENCPGNSCLSPRRFCACVGMRFVGPRRLLVMYQKGKSGFATRGGIKLDQHII